MPCRRARPWPGPFTAWHVDGTALAGISGSWRGSLSRLGRWVLCSPRGLVSVEEPSAEVKVSTGDQTSADLLSGTLG